MPPTLKPNDDIETILRDKMDEILALIEAIVAGEPDTDLKLAELLDGEVETVKLAIVQKLREMVRERAQEKETELDLLLARQKQQLIARQKGMFERWLMWVMSEETLRKIRESFLMRPFTQRQVEHEGEELNRKGVIGLNIQQQGIDVSRRELGELHANVARAKGQEQARDTGKGRT